MSAWISKAEAIVARLKTLSALAGSEVIVDRQKDLDSELAAALGKLGSLVTVLFDRADPVPDSKRVTDGFYTVRIYSNEVLRDEEEEPADNVVEAVYGALDDWNPSGNPKAHCDFNTRITGGPGILPADNLLVYEMTVAARVTLPPPVFIEPDPEPEPTP